MQAAASRVEPHVCNPIDANGNLTADGTKTYYWNALNQLVEVKEGTTTLATFEYDGEGRRTEKAAAGVTRTYVYDAEDIVEERLSGSTTDTIRYYNGVGIDEPLARKNSANVITYYLADHLGSIVQETNASGAVTLGREYDPWGVAMQGASTSGYAFTGREWDSEIALYYYRARYYDASVGRFVAQDPAGLADGPNLSTYVRNRPTGAIDPTGNNTWAVQLGNVGAIVGGAIGGPAGALTGRVLVTTGAVLVGLYGPEVVDWGNSFFSKPPDNAYDPNGPKAPGRPTEENGFFPPKGGDTWVKPPRGKDEGWLDQDGRIWVPTGPTGPRNPHNPHWDVQNPRGGYQNVYPDSCLLR